MAQKVTVRLVDDLDGNTAAETVRFGLDGKAYEIDLNKRNAGQLRKALSKYVEASRRVSNGQRRRGAPHTTAGRVREWARANGYEVSDKGAIPNAVREAYEGAK